MIHVYVGYIGIHMYLEPYLRARLDARWGDALGASLAALGALAGALAGALGATAATAAPLPPCCFLAGLGGRWFFSPSPGRRRPHRHRPRLRTFGVAMTKQKMEELQGAGEDPLQHKRSKWVA